MSAHQLTCHMIGQAASVRPNVTDCLKFIQTLSSPENGGPCIILQALEASSSNSEQGSARLLSTIVLCL